MNLDAFSLSQCLLASLHPFHPKNNSNHLNPISHPRRTQDVSTKSQRRHKMKSRILAVALCAMFLVGVGFAAAQKDPMVGGAAMFPTKDIIDNAVNSADHTTLVAAVKAAGLVDTLKSAGPFTVFAPTNEAFAKLPAGTVDNLLKPENKAMLTKILTYHVVAGRFSTSDIMKLI